MVKPLVLPDDAARIAYRVAAPAKVENLITDFGHPQAIGSGRRSCSSEARVQREVNGRMDPDHLGRF
jgi:tRNA A37 threonylcarbamoyladenosine synthetase subunit TsaC/SUA5/YrdC